MKKGRKTVYSLLAFITIGVLAFGDFTTSKGVAPELSSAELTQEHRDNINDLHKENQEESKYTETESTSLEQGSEDLNEEQEDAKDKEDEKGNEEQEYDKDTREDK